MPAAFAGSCEIKIDALDHIRGSMAGRPRGVRKSNRSLMIKELQSLNIT